MRLIADELWGKPCLGYKVQIGLPGEATRSFDALQAVIRAGLPVPLHPCPLDSLHVSVFTLISVRSTDAGKEMHWQGLSRRCVADLEQLCRGRSRIDLLFDRLQVTPTAVIVTGVDRSGGIDAIRKHFSGVLRGTSLPVPSYDLIHVTLARFGQEFLLPDAIVDAMAATPIAVSAEVAAVELVRERVYPALETDNIATVYLPQRPYSH